MAMENNYYDGSRIFSRLAEYVGVEVDQANFVISQFVALALASLFRTVLHPSKTKSGTRHGFGLIFGLFIGYFCFGMQAIHLAGLPALCYIVIRTTSPDIMQRLVLAVALLYLSCIHLHRQIYDYASYTLDISGPLMIITQKVTSLAFCLHDGLTKNDSDLSKTQQFYAIKKIPSALEYFSYALQFPSLMAGPALYYKDYIDFIDGNNFLSAQSSSSQMATQNGNRMVFEPSAKRAVAKKVVMAMISVVIFVKFIPSYSIQGVKDDDFVQKSSLLYKLFYLHMATFLVRCKYYFAWLFADAICNNSGIGFNGFDNKGNPNWNKFSNISIIGFEFSTSLRSSIESWNIGTNIWLRRVVYDRVDKKYATVLTYGLSALWHGFYPGYYVTFANGALFTFAARNMRRTIRGYFTKTSELKLFYDIVTFATTKFVMAYITFTFVLLEFWAGLRLYVHMYMCLHILALLALFVVPRVIPRAQVSFASTATGTGTVTESFTNVLKTASRPISNNHHD
nr:membrane-bound O-acyltransferase domain-containing protein 2 [Onthophagus taurus]